LLCGMAAFVSLPILDSFPSVFRALVSKGTCQDFWFPKELRVDDSEGYLRHNVMSNDKYCIID